MRPFVPLPRRLRIDWRTYVGEAAERVKGSVRLIRQSFVRILGNSVCRSQKVRVPCVATAPYAVVARAESGVRGMEATSSVSALAHSARGAWGALHAPSRRQPTSATLRSGSRPVVGPSAGWRFMGKGSPVPQSCPFTLERHKGDTYWFGPKHGRTASVDVRLSGATSSRRSSVSRRSEHEQNHLR